MAVLGTKGMMRSDGSGWVRDGLTVAGGEVVKLCWRGHELRLQQVRG